MAYYDAYRQVPGWGTSSYKFASPLVPAYQPQPSWRGVDYYRAHGGYADPDTYNYAWARVRDRAAVGFGKEEARIWHRRVYGGLSDIRTLLPEDIGAAAGYEAWRSWKYHHGVYAQPLAGDRERQREAIIGIAVAEAHRLWKYTGVRHDSLGRLKACEAAGSTAVRILEHSYFGQQGYYDVDSRGRTLSRRSSRSSLRSFVDSVFSRSRSRGRSPSPSYLTANPGYTTEPYSRRHSFAGASASPYLGTASAIYSASPAGSTLSASPYVPSYAGSGGGGVTVIQPPRHSHSRHRSGSSHSHHGSGHRSRSRHRSSSRHRPHAHGHAHSVSFNNGGYYVGSGVPYGY